MIVCNTIDFSLPSTLPKWSQHILINVSIHNIYFNCFTTIPDPCNISLGMLPCFDGQTCYMQEQGCDGERHCVDGADEMGCE